MEFNYDAIIPAKINDETTKKFIVDSMIGGKLYPPSEISNYLQSVKQVDGSKPFENLSLPRVAALLAAIKKTGSITGIEEKRKIFYHKEADYNPDEDSEMFEEPVHASESAKDTIDNLIRRGNRDLKDNQWASAEESFDKVLDIDYSNKEAQIGMVYVRLKCSNPTELLRRLETNDYSADKQVVRAISYFEGDDYRNLCFACI